MPVYSKSSILASIAYNDVIYKDISKICDPIFKHFGIKTFIYMKCFPDGSRLNISSNNSWVRKGLEVGVHDNLSHIIETSKKSKNAGGEYYCIRAGLPTHNTLKCMFDHDIWNGFSIFKNKNNTTELFGFFGDRSSSQILDFYVNNIGKLQRFVIYFLQVAEQFISNVDESCRLQLIKPEQFKIKADAVFEADNLENFYNEVIIKRFYTERESHQFYLTKREAECLYFMSRGRTFKEISRSIDISERTVENHFNSIKQKMGIYCKSEAIEVFLENSLYPILDDEFSELYFKKVFHSKI